MGFDNKYPYTDFHEMNEDWFLLHFKEVMEAVHQNNETVKGLIEYIHSLGLVVIDDNAPALDKVYSSRHTQDLLDDKVDKVAGMGLSQNNFTNTLKNKLDGIEAGANKTVVDDYMAALQTNPVEGGVIYQALNSKVEKVPGKQLSQENYTSTEKTKLAGIADNATKTEIEIDDTFNSGLKIGTISINDVDTDLNVPVDDELSNISEYPLQNKAIYDLIQEILPEVTVTGNPISIDDASGFPAKSCEVTFYPIQSGSGDPSPENVRPISGWDSLVLNQHGKNWLKNALPDTYTISGFGTITKNADGSITLNGSTTSAKILSYNLYTGNMNDGINQCDEIKHLKAGTYYGTTGLAINDSVSLQLCQSNNKADTPTISTYIITSANITIDNTYKYNWIRLYVGANKTLNNVTIYPFICLSDETDKTYEPYQGQTHTATFPDTVYGGKYNYTTGKLTIDRIAKTFSELPTITLSQSGYFYTTISNKKAGNTNIISSVYKTSTSASVADMSDYEIKGHDSNQNVYFKDSRAEDTTELLSLVGNEYVCYELSTPTEITLTAEQIELLKGANVLWTDGDDITLKYSADIKQWVLNQ